MSSCYRTNDNKYSNAPPKMADGRHFTDYRPNCFLNNRIQVENDITNSYDMRLFLTRNAEKLMELNKKNSYVMNGSIECKKPYNQGTMLPEESKVVCNSQTCKVVHNYDNGLGMGRMYVEGELPECLQSFNSPPMNLDNNQCSPQTHAIQHNNAVNNNNMNVAVNNAVNNAAPQ
jgi:hypothetical protein